MSTLISSITTIVGGAVDWMEAYLGAITTSGNELLLFCVIFSFVGAGIGILKRLMRL